MRLDEINDLTQQEFVARLGWVFEHSPWVAERVWPERPFASVGHLSDCMSAVVLAASRIEQLALLRAHPDLGTRAQVSAGSASEQAGAGLNQLTQDEYDDLLRLNNNYRTKFDFPFLYAVKGSGKTAIFEALRARSEATHEIEFEEALRQVFRIARYRLEEL